MLDNERYSARLEPKYCEVRMKRILITVVLLMLLLPLVANDFDDGVKQMLALGRYTTLDGDKVFMSSTYWSDKGYDESRAYDFIAMSGYFFLAAHHKWGILSSSTIESEMNSADCIACPWANNYGAALLTLRLSGVYNNFGYGSYEELGDDGLMDAIETYIHRNVDRSALFDEEEYDED